MPNLGGWHGSDTPKNPYPGWLWCIAGWVALHGPWVNGVGSDKEDDRPQYCKNGSCGTGLDAVNECHFLSLSPLTGSKT